MDGEIGGAMGGAMGGQIGGQIGGQVGGQVVILLTPPQTPKHITTYNGPKIARPIFKNNIGYFTM